ncbi:Uncharacterised protein [Actinomyces bovis]|uniref:Uncharacterized protein n=1 Tax=Actinomyces bovis TaxID=1658 RepID=A0ABY1VS49_9ACTO|nr:hypothetical protein [Actinomyces bovis]SPT55044.1 Uncharacterised protein [Actinomyces bovis]VEG56208.1 Uncharacterised protein [Actinomyces israelii]
MNHTFHPKDRATEPALASRRPSRRAALTLGALGTLTLGGLATWAYLPGGYLSYDARLFRAMKADPMAAIPLLGRKPVFVMDHEPAGLLSIENTNPSLERLFRDDSIGQDALVQELITRAQEVGWTHDPSNSQNDWWSSTRTHKTFSAFSLSIHPLKSLKPEEQFYNSVSISISQR